MDFITPIVQQIPDTAKDIRLNLDAVLSRSRLSRMSLAVSGIC